MAKKKTEDREIVVANAEKLREIAALIHECAAAYEAQADRMVQNSIEFIEYKGFPTIRDKVVKLARGNAGSVADAVQEQIDAKRMESICEEPANYVGSALQKQVPKGK